MFYISFSNRNFLLLLVFRTRDSKGSGELVREACLGVRRGWNFIQGVFSYLDSFAKFLDLTLSVTSRGWITMGCCDFERSQNPKPLSCHDVGFQCYDVGRLYFVPLSVTS